MNTYLCHVLTLQLKNKSLLLRKFKKKLVSKYIENIVKTDFTITVQSYCCDTHRTQQVKYSATNHPHVISTLLTKMPKPRSNSLENQTEKFMTATPTIGCFQDSSRSKMCRFCNFLLILQCLVSSKNSYLIYCYFYFALTNLCKILLCACSDRVTAK